ncbi:hypothetical protein HMPREF9103_01892 [Lentilactobacillus parafarraginis F0439]|uniref:Uncharacterized protein n=1 Tax=Lentilactobacillus parafarraginis F0439 TaxID=797515 RepID=G9ZQ85_9LACO|nr:hypothetical protein HMPREF9103_01892 [Lentilactobacillus parafarraginis F0439]
MIGSSFGNQSVFAVPRLNKNRLDIPNNPGLPNGVSLVTFELIVLF